MADDTKKQSVSSGNIEKKDDQLTNETININVEVSDANVLIYAIKLPGAPLIVVDSKSQSIPSPSDLYDIPFVRGVIGTQNIGNSIVLRIQIREEPLTAQSLSTIMAAITDLYTRCWLIQQKRFSDLMDYTQTSDPRFVREANLRVGTMSHNSPAIIDLLLNTGTIAGGAATLVLVLTKAIDAIAQTPLRYEATKLKNEKEIQEQQIRQKQTQLGQQIATQKAEIEDIGKQQEQQLAAERKLLELERQRMLLDIEKQKLEVETEKQRTAIDRERLEFEKNRIIIVQEIAVTMVGQLLSNEDRADAGRTEMLVHSLIPSLLQLAATDGIVTALPPAQPTGEDKGSSEQK